MAKERPKMLDEMTDEEFVNQFGHPKSKCLDDGIFCAVCNTKAPRVLRHDRLAFNAGMSSTDHGWMVVMFPWQDSTRDYGSIPRAWDERQRICPKCAKRVASYIDLLKDTSKEHLDEDLLCDDA